ncbi:MAG: sodium:solute symporter family protein [Candidatus Paceibacterota bacterium]
MTLSPIDLGIIIVYLVGILLFGWWLSRKESADDYFVNGRKTPVWLLLFTLISTAIGAGTLIGTAGETYKTGLSFALTVVIFFSSSWVLMAILAPRIKRWADTNQAYTLGDFLAYRFSERTRLLVSGIIVLAYVMIMALQFVAFALLLETIGGFQYGYVLLATGLFTILYTALAGLRGVFYTDAVQFIVLIFVFVALFIYGFSILDFSEMIAAAPASHFDIYNFAGPVFFYAAVILGIPYVLVSMELWQRIYSAKSVTTIRRTLLGAGALHILAYISAAIFGFMALQLVPGVPSDTVLFHLMTELLPVGIFGLGVASILAVLMSSVDSMIMVGSASLTKDFLPRFKPDLSSRSFLRAGRVFSFMYGSVALLIALFVPDIVQLVVAAGQISLVFAPAVLGGLLWVRVDEKAAFWSTLVGFILTLAFLPFIPNVAFVPGFFVSIIIFLFFTLKNKTPFSEAPRPAVE